MRCKIDLLVSNVLKMQADALWQLAHTAVATSWHGMLAQRRSYDSCNGVHLAQTVLLSQVYAALSKV